jgi:EF hand domain-containing protein
MEEDMHRIRRHWVTGLGATAFLLTGVCLTTAALGAVETPAPKDKMALGEADVKRLILLMDNDKNGKISEAEFMRFMKAEFQRLDVDGSGELDVKELKKSQLRPTTFLSVGK